MALTKLLFGPAILLIAGVLVPSSAFPQAAVEYGAAASRSTAMGAQAASAMRSSTRTTPRQPAARGGLTPPGPVSKNLETVMAENRQKLENASKAGGGTVQIESTPAKATVSVDGNPVGVSPLELKLPEGKHLVELAHPQYAPWQMEVTVTAHESTTVTAQLEKKYKSSITLSIQ